MNTYLLYIKSHMEVPDWEQEIECKNRKEAISGSSTFKKTHDTTLVQVGTLEMKMAESHDELEYFKDKDSLVVVAMGKGVNEFYGESTRNGLALPGMPLRENRFKTINSEKLSAYEKALYLVREINRQVQCAATVATFNLKFFQ